MAGKPPGMQMPKGVGQNLQAAIAGQSAPANPNTQNERRDPHYKSLEDLNRIRRALEMALEPYEEGPPDPKADVMHMMRGVIDRIINGVSPVDALEAGIQSIVPSPLAGAGGLGSAVAPATAPGLGMPGMPMPPPQGGQLGSAPPMPMPGVSPGGLPGQQ